MHELKDTTIIPTYFQNLELRNGVWHSLKQEEISYPTEGNENCFQIEENSFWFKHRNQCIISLVKKYCANDTFFDIGGGNGYVSSGLEKSGIEVVLVEPGIKGCLNAQKRGLKNVVCATLSEAIISKNKIDAIGLFDVVEHIKDDELFLKNFFDYLKPGGYLFITVPAYRFLWSKDDDYAGHFQRYTSSKLDKMLARCNYSVLYSGYIFSFLPLPIFISRTIPSILRLGSNPESITKQNNEHKEKKGLVNTILQKFLNWELKMISANKRIPLGGSCIVVAQKPY